MGTDSRQVFWQKDLGQKDEAEDSIRDCVGPVL